MQPRQHLELNPWLGHCPEGIGLPVRLLHLFPHDYVETRAVLVAEDEASVVIVSGGVDVERALEVHAVEGRVTCRRGERKGVFRSTLVLDTSESGPATPNKATLQHNTGHIPKHFQSLVLGGHTFHSHAPKAPPSPSQILTNQPLSLHGLGPTYDQSYNLPFVLTASALSFPGLN